MQGLEQVCLLKIDLTTIPPEALQPPVKIGEESLKVLVCEVESKIEGSMLESRVLVAGMEWNAVKLQQGMLEEFLKGSRSRKMKSDIQRMGLFGNL